MKFVALLRGINVGGNKKVEMGKLKSIFEQMGFKNVKTILNTGNVIFESAEKSTDKLSTKIFGQLQKSFGFEIGTIVVPIAEIQKLAEENPFKKIKVHEKIRLYVTFLPKNPKGKLKLPYRSENKSFAVFMQTPLAVFSVLDLSDAHTPEVMEILDKTYGKEITTRNWNTVLKFLK